MRFDLKIIASWIEPGSRVLDLGCGEGELLQYLKEQKGVKATGIEKDEAEVAVCIDKGISVLQGDFNLEVADYPPDSFDYIVISQTLQQVYEPVALIDTLLTIGTKVIVSFPNFSYWRIRLQLLFAGYAPKSKELPYEWYNTPNIRVITLRDFRNFAREKDIAILKEVAINTHRQQETGNIVSFLPNLRATYGIFLIGRGERQDAGWRSGEEMVEKLIFQDLTDPKTCSLEAWLGILLQERTENRIHMPFLPDVECFHLLHYALPMLDNNSSLDAS